MGNNNIPVFSSFCISRLAQLLNANTKITWRSEYLFGEAKIDVFGNSENSAIFVELELRREDPVNNVIKIWRSLERRIGEMPYRQITMVHIFSSFCKPERSKMKNAVFTGEKMSEALNVKYRRIDWNVDPPKKYQLYCLSEWEENISKLSDEIVKIVH